MEKNSDESLQKRCPWESDAASNFCHFLTIRHVLICANCASSAFKKKIHTEGTQD